MTSDASYADLALTGNEGLDLVLGGGIVREHLYLLEGSPGTGKTTLALQFVLEGARLGERCLYVTLSETDSELRLTANAHGWSVPENLEIFELVPPESLLDADQQQSLLYSSDLELGETMRLLLDVVEREKPSRIVIDSLSEIRLLAQSSLRYRRQILALKHFFARNSATVLMLDDLTSEALDKTVHSVAHGVIRLEELAPNYGAERRRLRVLKYRAKKFRGGFHDFTIRTGVFDVFPRLETLNQSRVYARGQQTSGIGELDSLLGGGMDRGASAILLGPSGAGKSVLAMHFAAAAIARGESVAMFVFEEEIGITERRALAMGFDLDALTATGRLLIRQVDAAEMSPGEFSNLVQNHVEKLNVTAVIIDSLNGYHAAMPEETYLTLHLHALLQYLNRQGATTFVTVAQHGLIGQMTSPVDVSYLADTVILLRFFEAFGEIRRAVSIMKKRTGRHENTIREYRIGSNGFTIGEPIKGFQGILRGVPSYQPDGREHLLADDQA